jgi:hypothetical protein
MLVVRSRQEIIKPCGRNSRFFVIVSTLLLYIGSLCFS